jgi:hypothetical protein
MVSIFDVPEGLVSTSVVEVSTAEVFGITTFTTFLIPIQYLRLDAASTPGTEDFVS